MPITPFHIGIPGLLSFRWPKQVDMFSAVFGAIIVDIDFFISLIMDTPVHHRLHSLIGVFTLSLILIAFAYILKKPIVRLKERFNIETATSFGAIAAGAFIGTYSHLFFDSLIYDDVNLLYPGNGNFLFAGGSQVIFITVYAITGLTLALHQFKLYNSTKNKDKVKKDKTKE
jgi:membrane-bound metal-dependent hydrolase YbcI (DUF457 family)